MKITSNVHEKVSAANKRYLKFKDKFRAFFESGKWLTEPQSIIALQLQEQFEDNYFEILYLGMRLRFQLIVSFDKNSLLEPKVICTKHQPPYADIGVHVGSFSYTGPGFTDFEVDAGHDPIHIEESAGEIMLHFINLALTQPLN